MNFFEHQKKAQRHTQLLILLFMAAVVAIIAVTTLFLAGIYVYFNDIPLLLFLRDPFAYVDDAVMMKVTIGVVLFVFIGSLYEYLNLSRGGRSVAEALSGRQLNYNDADDKERLLLNVVEEMSIASGVSPPTVYLLNENGINAFAAGMTLDDAVIGVTKGAVETLDRNELQGVIAHEFSHIFNGDMRLNLQLTATLNGILLIGQVGRFILRSLSDHSYSSRSSGGKKGSASGYLFILGLGLLVIGYAGTFFGSIIKATVSRKREYLADATAVQYTRYPRGISGALKKIAYYSSHLRAPAAGAYSHLYFAEGVGIFLTSLMATHPPLEDRIKRIEPRWNGRIPEYKPRKTPEKEKAEAKARHEQEKRRRFTEGAIAMAMMRVGQIKEGEVEQVQESIKALDQRVLARLDEPLGAQAVLLSLLYDSAHKEALFAAIKEENPYLLLEFANFLKEGHTELRQQSTLIVSLSLNALKSLSAEQFLRFNKIADAFIDIDKKVSLFEWSMQYIIRRPVETHLGIRKVPKSTHTHLGAVKNEVEILLSMLLQAQYADEEDARAAFAVTKRAIQAGALQYRPRTEIDHKAFIGAVESIEKVRAGVAERIFEGVLYSIRIDGEVTATEKALVHAIAQLIQVPLPREFVPDMTNQMKDNDENG